MIISKRYIHNALIAKDNLIQNEWQGDKYSISVHIHKISSFFFRFFFFVFKSTHRYRQRTDIHCAPYRNTHTIKLALQCKMIENEKKEEKKEKKNELFAKFIYKQFFGVCKKKTVTRLPKKQIHKHQKPGGKNNGNAQKKKWKYIKLIPRIVIFKYKKKNKKMSNRAIFIREISDSYSSFLFCCFLCLFG